MNRRFKAPSIQAKLKPVALAKAYWMSDFADKLLLIRKELAGRIDWKSAEALYSVGVPPEEAAEIAAYDMAPVPYGWNLAGE